MRLIAISALCLGALLFTACVRPIANEDGMGVVVEPLASLTRVKEGEAIASEAITSLSEGQVALAEQMENEAVAAAAAAAEQKKEVEEAILAAKDDMETDWVAILAGVLGVGGVGAVGAKYRKKLLKTPPPAA